MLLALALDFIAIAGGTRDLLVGTKLGTIFWALWATIPNRLPRAFPEFRPRFTQPQAARGLQSKLPYYTEDGSGTVTKTLHHWLDRVKWPAPIWETVDGTDVLTYLSPEYIRRCIAACEPFYSKGVCCEEPEYKVDFSDRRA
jgi:hypothetical protein